MSVYEQLMGIGDWSIRLVPDTPREVRDLITPFSYVVIMPERVAARDMSSTLLPLAKYHGIVIRPGPQLDIGGHHISYLFGNGDRYYTMNSSGFDLPRQARVGGPGGGGTTLTTHLAGVVANLDGFTIGTVTDPSSGLRRIIETVQWISHRQLLDSICDYWDVEWKLSNTGVLDVGGYSDLWPTVTAAVTPNAAGRNIGLQGFESLIGVRDDFFEYAGRVYVLSRGGIGEAGGVSPNYYGFNGQKLWVSAVYDGQSVPPFDHTFAAQRIIGTLSQNGRANQVTVSTDQFDVTGTVQPGGRVYAYDPETTLSNIAGTPIYWQGDVIQPVELRCLSARWPVEDGLGVLLRYYTGTPGSATENYLDLTDYIEWELPGTELEIGSTVKAERYMR